MDLASSFFTQIKEEEFRENGEREECMRKKGKRGKRQGGGD